MYSEQIEKLIELALADGEIREKEREILLRRAVAEGIDKDEFEMVLEARIYARTKGSVVETIVPKSSRLGEIRKCPACGAIAESFATQCKDCGSEFRNIEASESVVKFFERLDEIEATRGDNYYSQSPKKSTGIGTVLLWIFFWYALIPIKGLQILLNRTRSTKWSAIDFRKEELVMNYPVPVSKESMLEFLTLASSKIYNASYLNLFSEDTKYENAWNRVWLKKIEQINAMASMSMRGDMNSLSYIDNLVQKSRKTVKSNDMKLFQVLGVGAFLFFGLFVMSFIVGQKEQENLVKYGAVVDTATKLIENKKYDEAEQLVVNVDDRHALAIRCKIQLAKLSLQLDELEPLLANEEYAKVRLGLEKIRWFKINQVTNGLLTDIEEEYFKNFLQRKARVNNQMPEDKRIEIESSL